MQHNASLTVLVLSAVTCGASAQVTVEYAPTTIPAGVPTAITISISSTEPFGLAAIAMIIQTDPGLTADSFAWLSGLDNPDEYFATTDLPSPSTVSFVDPGPQIDATPFPIATITVTADTAAAGTELTMTPFPEGSEADIVESTGFSSMSIDAGRSVTLTVTGTSGDGDSDGGTGGDDDGGTGGGAGGGTGGGDAGGGAGSGGGGDTGDGGDTGSDDADQNGDEPPGDGGEDQDAPDVGGGDDASPDDGDAGDMGEDGGTANDGGEDVDVDDGDAGGDEPGEGVDAGSGDAPGTDGGPDADGATDDDESGGDEDGATVDTRSLCGLGMIVPGLFTLASLSGMKLYRRRRW